MLLLIWKLFKLLIFGLSPALCAKRDCEKAFWGRAEAADYCCLKLCDSHCEDLCDCLARAATEARKLAQEIS